MKRYFKYLALLGVIALVAACSPSDGGTTTTAAQATSTTVSGIGEGRSIGLAFDVGGRGDKSFNDLAALAYDQGKIDYGFTGSDLSPDASGSDREENLRLLAEADHELIIANGFAFNQNVWRVGTEFPDIMFGIVDDCPVDESFAVAEMDNVRCMLFAEEQGSFLVGVAAALKSTTGTIGFIGGVQIPLIEKFQAGFEAGAKAAKPDITILPARYLSQPPDFSGFNDSAAGNEAAIALYEAGADVVFHAAGGSGLGLFQAARDLSTADSHLWAIGVDADQYNSVEDDTLRPHILTSMLKRVDVAVGKLISDFLNDDFTPGSVVHDLAVDGVGYSTSGGFIDDIVSQIDDFAAQIKAGTITVPTTP